MDISLSKDDVVTRLWNAYKKSPEYKNKGMVEAIPPHHLCVEKQEKIGLRDIYNKFITALENTSDANLKLKERTVGDWKAEWRNMHELLFHHILKERGRWRSCDVR